MEMVRGVVMEVGAVPGMEVGVVRGMVLVPVLGEVGLVTDMKDNGYLMATNYITMMVLTDQNIIMEVVVTVLATGKYQNQKIPVFSVICSNISIWCNILTVFIQNKLFFINIHLVNYLFQLLIVFLV